MNIVLIIGGLTRDPESQNIGDDSKTSVTKFTVAVDREGKKDEADFIRVTAFGKLAETVDKYLSKGRQVAVRGRIQTGSYKDRDGKTVYTQDVIASQVKFLGSSKTEGTVKKEAEDQVDVVDDDDNTEDVPF